MDKNLEKTTATVIASLNIAVIDVIKQNSKEIAEVAQANANLLVSIAMEPSITIMKTFASEENSALEIVEVMEAYIKAYKEIVKQVQEGGNS